MAKLGDLEIGDKSSPFDCGGAFRLLTKPRDNHRVKLPSGWEVEVESGNSYVVVRGGGATDAASAFNLGYEAAQEGLDWFCAEGRENLVVTESDREYFVWWREGPAQVLRAVGIGPQAISGHMTFEVKDEYGNIVTPQPGPPLKYHDSLRYFRLSQTTEDLFDAYRNLWLSFEFLLSHKYPFPGGKEIDWLEKSLAAVHADFDLTNAVQINGPDVVQELIDDLYRNVRLPLFHAKDARDRLTPQDMGDKKKVSEALEKLANLVIFLNEKWIGIRRISSRFSPDMHNKIVQTILVDKVMYLSEYSGLLNEGLTVETAGNSVGINHRPAPELSRPGLEQVLASIDAQGLKRLRSIRSFFIADDVKPLILQDFEATVTPEGIDRFEVQFGLEQVSIQQPKSFFRL